MFKCFENVLGVLSVMFYHLQMSRLSVEICTQNNSFWKLETVYYYEVYGGFISTLNLAYIHLGISQRKFTCIPLNNIPLFWEMMRFQKILNWGFMAMSSSLLSFHPLRFFTIEMADCAAAHKRAAVEMCLGLYGQWLMKSVEIAV